MDYGIPENKFGIQKLQTFILITNLFILIIGRRHYQLKSTSQHSEKSVAMKWLYYAGQSYYDDVELFFNQNILIYLSCIKQWKYKNKSMPK